MKWAGRSPDQEWAEEKAERRKEKQRTDVGEKQNHTWGFDVGVENVVV